MESFEKIKMGLKGVADVLNAVDKAVAESQGSTDAPEIIAAKMGVNLGKQLDPLTPLAATPEEADLEAEEMILTRQKKLTKVIEEKIGGMLSAME